MGGNDPDGSAGRSGTIRPVGIELNKSGLVRVDHASEACARLATLNATPKPNDCPTIRFELQAHTFVVHLYHFNVEGYLNPISYIHFIPLLAVVAVNSRHL